MTERSPDAQTMLPLAAIAEQIRAIIEHAKTRPYDDLWYLRTEFLFAYRLLHQACSDRRKAEKLERQSQRRASRVKDWAPPRKPGGPHGK